MLNQLLKFTLVSSALLWLRPRWKGLLALGAFVLLVHVLHGEYLGYVELSGNGDFLVWSYVLKWLVLAAAVLAYMAFLVYGSRRAPPARRVASKPPEPGAADTLPAGEPVGDGFDFLRRKKHLDSRADKIIAAKKRGDRA